MLFRTLVLVLFTFLFVCSSCMCSLSGTVGSEFEEDSRDGGIISSDKESLDKDALQKSLVCKRIKKEYYANPGSQIVKFGFLSNSKYVFSVAHSGWLTAYDVKSLSIRSQLKLNGFVSSNTASFQSDIPFFVIFDGVAIRFFSMLGDKFVELPSVVEQRENVSKILLTKFESFALLTVVHVSGRVSLTLIKYVVSHSSVDLQMHLKSELKTQSKPENIYIHPKSHLIVVIKDRSSFTYSPRLNGKSFEVNKRIEKSWDVNIHQIVFHESMPVYAVQLETAVFLYSGIENKFVYTIKRNVEGSILFYGNRMFGFNFDGSVVVWDLSFFPSFKMVGVSQEKTIHKIPKTMNVIYSKMHQLFFVLSGSTIEFTQDVFLSPFHALTSFAKNIISCGAIPWWIVNKGKGRLLLVPKWESARSKIVDISTKEILSMKCSQTSQRIAFVTENNVSVWNIVLSDKDLSFRKEGEFISPRTDNDSEIGVAFSSNEENVFLGHGDKYLYLFDGKGVRYKQKLNMNVKQIQKMTSSDRLIVTSLDPLRGAYFSLVDVQSNEPIFREKFESPLLGREPLTTYLYAPLNLIVSKQFQKIYVWRIEDSHFQVSDEFLPSKKEIILDLSFTNKHIFILLYSTDKKIMSVLRMLIDKGQMVNPILIPLDVNIETDKSELILIQSNESNSLSVITNNFVSSWKCE